MSKSEETLPLLLETIRIEEGKAQHLDYHERRLNATRKALFSPKQDLVLEELLEPPGEGVYRCRILYNTEIRSIEYLPYAVREIGTITLVESQITYNFKFADRKVFDTLRSLFPASDEILVTKGGFITDTTIANVAFRKNGTWFTPKEALLNGTTRQRLIEDGFLKLKSIRKEEIGHFDGFALMNAMIGFSIINPTWLGIQKNERE